MPDLFNESGLQIKTLTEIRQELVDELIVIYGEDINVEQNSQDGQQVNIYAQGGVDLREVLQQVNSNFDPDQAFGRTLDQRVAINGIERNGGTYTFTPVSISAGMALNLVGLDDQSAELTPNVSNLYTVKDSAGTEFYLLNSVSFTVPETQSLTFRSAAIGQVETQLNTINIPVTVIAGVDAVNNPLGALAVGVDEESDLELKVRRRTSVALPSLGYLDGIEADLLNLSGVSIARVYENDTGIIDPDGTPAHHIWAIVEGGDPSEIGSILYKKKSSGSGMRGEETVEILRPNGSLYTAKYDRPGVEDLYIRFSLAIIGGGFIDENSVKISIVEGLLWEVGLDAATDEIIDFLKTQNSKYRITGAQISKNGADWFEVVSVSSPQNRFVNDVSRIVIL